MAIWQCVTVWHNDSVINYSKVRPFNGKVTKWQCGKWPKGKILSWLCDKMTVWSMTLLWDHSMAKWQNDNVTNDSKVRSFHDSVTKWQCDKMTVWSMTQQCKHSMAKWQNDSVTNYSEVRCLDGKIAKWHCDNVTVWILKIMTWRQNDKVTRWLNENLLECHELPKLPRCISSSVPSTEQASGYRHVAEHDSLANNSGTKGNIKRNKTTVIHKFL